VKLFSVPSIRKTRREKCSSESGRSADDFGGGVGDIEVVGADVGGWVRPIRVIRVRNVVDEDIESTCQLLTSKTVVTRSDRLQGHHVTLETRLTNLPSPTSTTTTPKNNPKTANLAVSG
jgi:hypothetical protein